MIDPEFNNHIRGLPALRSAPLKPPWEHRLNTAARKMALLKCCIDIPEFSVYEIVLFNANKNCLERQAMWVAGSFAK